MRLSWVAGGARLAAAAGCALRRLFACSQLEILSRFSWGAVCPPQSLSGKWMFYSAASKRYSVMSLRPLHRACCQS